MGVVFDCLVLLANRIMATQILVAANGLAEQEQEQLLLSLSSPIGWYHACRSHSKSR